MKKPRTISALPASALPALAALAATTLVLAGCSSAGGDDSAGGGAGASGDALRVVATTTQLADFAAIVGGDDIELTGLLPLGGSAHHFDPTPADLLALGSADVLIVNGAGLETFIESAVDASGFDGLLIEAGEGVDLVLAGEITQEALDASEHAHDEHEHDHDEAHHDHADDDHADHDHADHAHDHGDHAHDHDHDHGDLNPHLWTSPRFAADMVHEIAEGLGEADPPHATQYDERAHAYMAQLAELDEWIAAQFAAVPADERVLVSGHDSLRYYLHDYGIAFAGSILPSFEDNAEPSAAEIEVLVAAIAERGVQAIFVESSMSPKLAETVGREAGVTVVSESALYADSLGAPGSGAENYIDATVHNTATILEAWGYTVAPLPEALQ